jgi:hypothetical protein
MFKLIINQTNVWVSSETDAGSLFNSNFCKGYCTFRDAVRRLHGESLFATRVDATSRHLANPDTFRLTNIDSYS